jgi:small subunit ribosomal protein S17
VPGRQKSLVGTVVADKMDKTVVVAVETTTRHRIYHKIFTRTKRYMAHDDRLDAKRGDTVRILETRPLSRHKRWRVAEVIQRGEVAEVAPKEIDAELIERPREKAEAETAVPAAEAFAAEETPGAETALPEAEAESATAEAAAAGEEATAESADMAEGQDGPDAEDAATEAGTDEGDAVEGDEP